jgi:hypothetical protein
MPDLIAVLHNFGRVAKFLRGPDDPLVRALQDYISQLYDVQNQGLYDVVIYDRLFRAIFWKDLATAMTTYHEWGLFQGKCAMVLQPSSGNGGGSGGGSGSGQSGGGRGAGRIGAGASVSWASNSYGSSGTGGNNNQHSLRGYPNACMNYNRGLVCKVSPCRYDHTCNYCGGAHTRVSTH